MGSLLDAAATIEIATARSTADATHAHGVVFSVAHSATSVTMPGTIPVNCRGRYWRYLSMGENVQWGFVLDGNTAPTLVYGQASALGTGHLARAPTAVDGIPEHVFCPVNATQVVYISETAAAGFFEAVLSGERTGK